MVSVVFTAAQLSPQPLSTTFRDNKKLNEYAHTLMQTCTYNTHITCKHTHTHEHTSLPLRVARAHV